MWTVLCGVLSYSRHGESFAAIVCTFVGGAGFWIFRQTISPTPAMFAGHGRTDVLARTNTFVEWWAVKLFNMPTKSPRQSLGEVIVYNKEQAIKYGLWVGGLVGFLKCFLGWGIIGGLLISHLCLLLPILGILFGKIHWYWGQHKKGIIYDFFVWIYKKLDKEFPGFREMSEKTVGVVIIAPNTIIPIWFYDGGLLTYFGGI